MHIATAHPTNLYGIEAITITSDRRFPRHAHDHFGIGRIVAGGHASWSALGPVEAVAGDLIAVNPEEMHDRSPLAGQDRSWRMLYIPSAAIASVTGRAVDTLELRFAATRDERLAQRFDHAFGRLTSDDPEAADEAFTSLLGSLFDDRSGAIEPMTSCTEHSAAVARVLQRIHDCPSRLASLDELSRVARLDRFALLRRFASEVGITPHAYAMQLRVRIARRAIVTGTSLANAAASAGFADQSHMTRAFARQFGLSPGRFRTRSQRSGRNIVQDPSR